MKYLGRSFRSEITTDGCRYEIALQLLRRVLLFLVMVIVPCLVSFLAIHYLISILFRFLILHSLLFQTNVPMNSMMVDHLRRNNTGVDASQSVQKMSMRLEICGQTVGEPTVLKFMDLENFPGKVSKEVDNFIKRCGSKPLCSSTALFHNYRVGGHRVDGNLTKVPNEIINSVNLDSFVQEGGWVMPSSGCTPVRSIAVIIPFRNRKQHLPVLLHRLFPLWHQQGHIHVRVFVIEQADSDSFNRGKLRNVGFREVQKFFPYDCIVFHDVDLIPERYSSQYDCSRTPMHLSAYLQKFNYSILYPQLFGGVQVLTPEQYQKANGFPNTFWSWGAEDDNFYLRLIKQHKLELHRPTREEASYFMLPHPDEDVWVEQMKEKTKSDMKIYKKLKKVQQKQLEKVMKRSLHLFKKDGLNNLQYAVVSVKIQPHYTRISVNLQRDKDIDIFDMDISPSAEPDVKMWDMPIIEE